jgi:5-aminopentanamidase
MIARMIDGISPEEAGALIGPDGALLKNYRKTHLWGQDEKKLRQPG